MICILLSACAVKKPSSSIEGAKSLSRAQLKQFYASRENNTIDYTTLQGRAKAKLGMNKQAFNTSATVRIKHNEAIWISFTSLLSMEVARLMITPERIQIINRLNRSYIDAPFDSIKSYMTAPIGFSELEQLLTGQSPTYSQETSSSVFSIDNGYQLIGTHGSLDYTMLFDQEVALLSNTIQDSSKHQSLKIEYSKFESEANKQKIPYKVDMMINSSDQAFNLSLDYASIQIDESMETPFTIPENYKQISMP